MSAPSEERLLAFLEGRSDEAERAEVLAALDADPELRHRLQSAAAGLAYTNIVVDTVISGETAATVGVAGSAGVTRPGPSKVSPWWVPISVAATLVLAVPSTFVLARGSDSGGAPTASLETGMPVGSQPSFVLVLHGTWPDAAGLPAEEGRARALEYWAWTSSLAEHGTLVAAGDLRWEPGARLGPSGAVAAVDADEVRSNDFVVGMLTLRVASYEEALAVASACPHLKYGGSVSVRRVGSGFVTVPGMDDWSG